MHSCISEPLEKFTAHRCGALHLAACDIKINKKKKPGTDVEHTDSDSASGTETDGHHGRITLLGTVRWCK